MFCVGNRKYTRISPLTIPPSLLGEMGQLKEGINIRCGLRMRRISRRTSGRKLISPDHTPLAFVKPA